LLKIIKIDLTVS